MEAPKRAFRLTLRLDADSRVDLASTLENLALLVARDELTTGASGGYDSGYVYELLHDPDQTHEQYFKQLREYLDSKYKDKAQPHAG